MFYIGITNNLEGRVYQHKFKVIPGFTNKYNINKLVYYEEYDDVYEAIYREKQLKNWHRQWKINIIKKYNPSFKDLSEEWFEKKKKK
jgi:putative endonuclease